MNPSLPSAIRTAIRTGSVWEKINPLLWALTFATSTDEIERMWKAELTKETNANAVEGK